MSNQLPPPRVPSKSELFSCSIASRSVHFVIGGMSPTSPLNVRLACGVAVCVAVAVAVGVNVALGVGVKVAVAVGVNVAVAVGLAVAVGVGGLAVAVGEYAGAGVRV